MENEIKRPVGRPRVENKKPRYSVYTDSNKFTHIQVSKPVHQRLAKLKSSKRMTSANEVISWLIGTQETA